jgi:hypothetical protein
MRPFLLPLASLLLGTLLLASCAPVYRAERPAGGEVAAPQRSSPARSSAQKAPAAAATSSPAA